jgi:hypothetical protein
VENIPEKNIHFLLAALGGDNHVLFEILVCICPVANFAHHERANMLSQHSSI